MSVELSRRIAAAFAAGRATVPERVQLRTALGAAAIAASADQPDDGPGIMATQVTVDDLDEAAQRLLVDLETRTA